MEKVLDRLVERHIIKKNSNKELYLLVDSMCLASKNIYNYATYIMRQCYNITNKLYLGEILNSKEGIPFLKLISMIEYKGTLEGINIIKITEEYTLGTSFLDNERVIKENYNKKRRIYRGLFKSNRGVLINADVNASNQIIRKQYPKISYIVNDNILKPRKVYINKKKVR